jgi:hypothetical protein
MLVLFCTFQLFQLNKLNTISLHSRGCRCRDRMVVDLTTTYEISAYRH